MTTVQTIKKLQKGFTLIELLIVMAVVGVLAGVVLVAINPSEQLARARDTQRKSIVGTMGRATQGYVTGQGLPAAPAISSTWQQRLVDAGDLRSVTTTTGNTICAPSSMIQGNFCYNPIGLTGDFVIWTYVENASDKLKAGNGVACAATAAGAYIFDSTAGKSGLICVNTTTGLTATTPAANIY